MTTTPEATSSPQNLPHPLLPWQPLAEELLVARLDDASRGVVSLAVRQLADAARPLSLAAVTKLLRKYGTDEAYESYAYLIPLVGRLDDSAKLELALKTTRELYRRATFADAEDLAAALWRVICTSPLPLLTEQGARIEAAAEPQGVDLSFIAFRRKAAASTPAACWAWLQENMSGDLLITEEQEKAADLDDIEIEREREASEMMLPLVHDPLLSTEWIISALDTLEYDGTPLEDILIRILAARDPAAAAAPLLRRLEAAIESDDEVMPDACIEALAEHASDAAVDFVLKKLVELRRLKQTPKVVQKVELLGRFFALCFHPQVPGLLVPLLAEGDQDDAAAYEIAIALCGYADAHILTALLPWAAAAKNKERLKEVAGPLLATGDLLGVAIPQRERWVKLRQEYDEEVEAVLAELDDEIEEEYDRHDPYVRSEAKVGRNDPCPCGSGKKYKKCCSA